MSSESLIQQANEYAARVGRVGDPSSRATSEALAKIAFIAGMKAGIEYVKAEQAKAKGEAQ